MIATTISVQEHMDNARRTFWVGVEDQDLKWCLRFGGQGKIIWIGEIVSRYTKNGKCEYYVENICDRLRVRGVKFVTQSLCMTNV